MFFFRKPSGILLTDGIGRPTPIVQNQHRLKFFACWQIIKKYLFYVQKTKKKIELILLYYLFFCIKFYYCQPCISPRYQTPNYTKMHLYGLSVDRSFTSNRVIGCRMIHLTCALSWRKCFWIIFVLYNEFRTSCRVVTILRSSSMFKSPSLWPSVIAVFSGY